MPYHQPPERVRASSRPSVLPLTTGLAIVVIVVLVIIAAASRSGGHARVSGTSAEHGRQSGTPHLPAEADWQAIQEVAAASSPSTPDSASADAAVSGSGDPAAALPPAGTRFVGTATWYCSDGRYGSPRSACPRGHGPGELIAAIDRKDSTFRNGDRVLVRSGGRSVIVTIVDVCACVDRRVIDLSVTAFVRLAGYGPNGWALGVLPVTLEAAPRKRTLPPTDEEGS